MAIFRRRSRFSRAFGRRRFRLGIGRMGRNGFFRYRGWRRGYGGFVRSRRRIWRPARMSPEVKSVRREFDDIAIANDVVGYLSLNALSIGSGTGNRIGKRVMGKYLHVRAWFRLAATSSEDIIRFAIVRRLFPGGVPANSTDVYSSPATSMPSIMAMRNLNNMNEYKVLRQAQITLSDGTSREKMLKFFIQKNLYTEWDETGVDNAFEKGCLFLMFWSTAGPAAPCVGSFQTRYGFTDE